MTDVTTAVRPGAYRSHGRPAVAIVARVVAAGLAVTAVAACHANVSIGQAQLSASQVESQTAHLVETQLHLPAPTVHCPGPLDAKVGAKETCTLTNQDSDKTYDVYVVVKSVSDGTANFTIEVGKTPISS